MDYSVLYITAGSKNEAVALARGLVEARLAACANVIDGVTSVYWWEGALQQGAEAVVIAKTKAALVERAIARVKELHSYDCPCVVALPITAGNPAFLDWVGAESL